MNVEIGTEAAQFPEKENSNRIFVAVCRIIKIAMLRKTKPTLKIWRVHFMRKMKPMLMATVL